MVHPKDCSLNAVCFSCTSGTVNALSLSRTLSPVIHTDLLLERIEAEEDPPSVFLSGPITSQLLNAQKVDFIPWPEENHSYLCFNIVLISYMTSSEPPHCDITSSHPVWPHVSQLWPQSASPLWPHVSKSTLLPSQKAIRVSKVYLPFHKLCIDFLNF